MLTLYNVMGVFEEALRKRAPNSPNRGVLAPGWKWSVTTPEKVRKKGGTYMEVRGNTIYYQKGRNRSGGSPGDVRMPVPSYPYFYLIVLTHMEDEIQSKMRELQ